MDSPTFFLSLVIVAIIVFLIVAMYPRQQPKTGGGKDTTDTTTTIYTYPQTTGISSWPFYTYPTYSGYYRPWNNTGRRWGGGGRRLIRFDWSM